MSGGTGDYPPIRVQRFSSVAVSMRRRLSIQETTRGLWRPIRRFSAVGLLVALAQSTPAAGAVDCGSGWAAYKTSANALIVCWQIQDGVLSVAAHHPDRIWLGIGFGEEMVGSSAVIGVPGLGSADEYDIRGFTGEEIVSAMTKTTSDHFFVASQRGTSLQFRKRLGNEDSIPMIWAVGQGRDLGMHAARGAFIIDRATGESRAGATQMWLWLHGATMFAAWGSYCRSAFS